VDGGVSLRYCPKYPKKVLQLSDINSALQNTQKTFYALDMNSQSFRPSVDETVNLLHLKIEDAEPDGMLKHIASTFDYQDQVLRDGINYKGKRIISFANVLKHHVFPLSEILVTLLDIGQKEMNNQVEIEFAVNLDPEEGEPKVFSFLQIRPIVEATEKNSINIESISKEDSVIISNSALGNGVIENICDIIYVKPESFNAASSAGIATEIEKLNTRFVKEEKNYIIVGPGRWGSSDPWLGIPVKWAQISAARLIVESGLENYRIDPSQGTHFFQNMTSFQVGYFTINPYREDGYFDVDYLNQQKAVYEDEFLRHIRLKNRWL
jgi:hypothetical protein